MKKPRIGILHYTAPPIVGGVENVIAQHTILLTANGYDVTIITGRGGNHESLSSAHVVQIPEIDSTYPQNVDITSSLINGIIPPSFEQLQQTIEEKLTPIMKDTDILLVHNVLHYHFNLPLTAYLYKLASLKHPKVVSWCHDFSPYTNHDINFPQHTNFPWNLLTKYDPHISYITISKEREKMFINLVSRSSSIQVIPNGVDPKLLLGLSSFGEHISSVLDYDSSDVIFLMPIRVTELKNIEFAIHTIKELKNMGVKAKLLVSGPPDPHVKETENYFENLQKLRTSLGVENEVVFLYQNNMSSYLAEMKHIMQLFELYRICDVILMTSFQEGFGLPAIEAFLSDKPFFTTPIPALEDLEFDPTHLIDLKKSPKEFSASIYQWMQKDDTFKLHKKMRQQYTWNSVFKTYLKPLIDKLS